MNIVFLLFPNLTQLDFTGPLQVLSRLPDANVALAAKTMDAVATDSVLTLNPTHDFETCPQADVFCIPGGFGIDDAMRDEATIDFVRRQALGAKYVSSVCTGAFILGTAGLLGGKKATTHWAYHDELTRVGAEPVKARVVRDENLFTGGGVTAGIDFAFTLMAEIAGEDHARAVQLGLEYDPAPPFDAGVPGKAAPETLKNQQARYAPRVEAFRKALDQALKQS